MFQAPDYTQTVSVRLSEVLADIGVDERIVLKRRRAWLLNESIANSTVQLWNRNVSQLMLGSQSEGTTTPGLHSDTDILLCFADNNLIEDWSNWRPGVHNLLMVQDDDVSPGYCLLQLLRHDVPLPYSNVPNEHYYRDKTGRILLRNTVYSVLAAAAVAATEVAGIVSAGVAANGPAAGVRYGPACTIFLQGTNIQDDIVGALPCKTWPLQGRQWLDQRGIDQWPSDDIKRYCSNTGCFVVGAGSKGSENLETEWRISTSRAERCLMLNLNITQIQCYVLMKMILKQFIKPFYEDSISSFMCKTVLLRLTSKTHSNFWRENNLIVCLTLCLSGLYNSVLNENCPHFIIPGNNLMARHFAFESKGDILKILQYILNSEGKALLEIEFDVLGARLQLKMNSLRLYNFCQLKTSHIVSGLLLRSNARMIDDNIMLSLYYIRNCSIEEAIKILLNNIFKLVSICNQSQGIDIIACKLVAPWFCTNLGSTLASLNIQQYNGISAEALSWISLGLNTDVSSSKLKLASMFYCIGDYHRTEIVLRDIEGRYDQNIVLPVCLCHTDLGPATREGFNVIADNHNEEALKYTTAFCVRFLPCEINCIPTELKYEMFRSTDEDLAVRVFSGNWMDWAVLDSLPYLYFLQYKTYRHLGRQYDKQRALSNLIRATAEDQELGHPETALNLLGQCMEQEEQSADALFCYILSLKQRGRNNAAKVLLCILLSKLVNDQARNQS